MIQRFPADTDKLIPVSVVKDFEADIKNVRAVGWIFRI